MSPNRTNKLKLDGTVRSDGNYKGCSKLSPRLDPTQEFQSSWYSIAQHLITCFKSSVGNL